MPARGANYNAPPHPETWRRLLLDAVDGAASYAASDDEARMLWPVLPDIDPKARPELEDYLQHRDIERFVAEAAYAPGDYFNELREQIENASKKQILDYYREQGP
jgi:glucose-6-phosphate 1-dehydrogenase